MSFSGSARHKRLLIASTLLVLLAAGCTPATLPVQPGGQQEKAEKREVPPVPGAKAADFIATDVNTGEKVSLADLKGQVVMLNFWATWCGPCQEEMPAMDAFQKETQGAVRVLALGGDSGESPEKLAAFAKERNLTFTVGHDGGAAILPYRVVGLPTTFFIDQNGIIRVRHSAPLTIEEMRRLGADTERMGEQQ